LQAMMTLLLQVELAVPQLVPLLVVHQLALPQPNVLPVTQLLHENFSLNSSACAYAHAISTSQPTSSWGAHCRESMNQRSRKG
jgi:hypothetical protein